MFRALPAYVVLAAVLLMLGCDDKATANHDADGGGGGAGDDASSPLLGVDASQPTPAFDGGTGACALQMPVVSCLGQNEGWCEEGWTQRGVPAVEVCPEGTLFKEQGCPGDGKIGYCVTNYVSVSVWGDVTWYYSSDPNRADEELNCQSDEGTWCPTTP
jgi:hypothetical protein